MNKTRHAPWIAATAASSLTLFIAVSGCASAEATNDSAWTVGIDDSITYETVRVMSQSSAGSIPDETASKEVNPVIELRCTQGSGGELSMRIDWQRFISSFNTEAGFKIDEGSQNWIKMGVDDSNKITLSRSASDVQKLVDAMSQGSTLGVEVVPYSESSVSVTYDLTGFGAALEELKSGC